MAFQKMHEVVFQRVGLNPIEIAKALRSLIDQFKLNQDELAQRVGKKDRRWLIICGCLVFLKKFKIAFLKGKSQWDMRRQF